MKWIAPHGAATSTERYRNAEPLIAGSNPDAAFFNTVLDELLAVIVAADMTPTDENLHQIADAIVYLTERAATSGVTKGAFWFGKTTANFTVPNPTLPEQNYIDFTTLKTYSAKSNLSGWTQTGTFVPPVGIDFTILITSKFWDIPEQASQQGGEAKYNHTDQVWSYWPKIISFQDAALTGTPTAPTPDAADQSTKIATTQFAHDFGQRYVTNCITEIPQDIKLELNNGTLTLKAGSKLHRAAGNLDDTITIAADITATISSSGQWMIILSAPNNLYSAKVEVSTSGPIASRPSSTTEARALYFATDENKIYLTGDGGTNWYSGAAYTLPLAIITVSGGAISSIDQIFNGFGYIGSTVFALPGVKGLIPNGRNADGTLKNTVMNVTAVQIRTYTGTAEECFFLNASGLPGYFTATSVAYDAEKNINYRVSNNEKLNNGIFGVLTFSSGQITSFSPKYAFHAVDYNDAAIKNADNVFTGLNTFKRFLGVGDGSNGVALQPGGSLGGIISLFGQSPSILLGYETIGYSSGFIRASAPMTAGPSDADNSIVTTVGKSKSANGYFKLGNGLIIQWGTVSGSALTYPTAFLSDTSYAITVAMVKTSATNNGYNYLYNHTATGCSVAQAAGDTSRWIAIGY